MTNKFEASFTDEALHILFDPTKDESLTARFYDPLAGTYSEYMHNSNGALSETLYIYGRALEAAKSLNSVLSIGLGIAYCEILSFCYAYIVRNQSKLSLTSFEAHPILRQKFKYWIESKLKPEDPFFIHYEKTLELCIRELSTRDLGPELKKEELVSSRIETLKSEIKSMMLQALESQELELSGSLLSANQILKSFDVILFDAFSSQSSPDLWTEEFLNELLKRASHSHSVFSTYACTGALKRALKNQGFELHIQAGFKGKRESTLAIRI